LPEPKNNSCNFIEPAIFCRAINRLSLIGCSYLCGTRDVLNTIPLVDEKRLKTIEEPGEILQPDKPNGNVPG
jgi:hypothetical protein